ncbi:MAG: DUF3185 family protein [Limisphaerales bacterium]
MNKAIGIALLAIGIMLIVFGVNASNSFNSDVSRFFNGHPTNETVWYLVGGVAACIIGVVTLLRGPKAV